MTSPLNIAREAIYKHFLDNVSDHDVFDGISMNRLNGSPPGRLSLAAEEAPQPDDAEMWMRLVVRHTNKTQTSLGRTGNRRFRHDVTTFFSVFVPLSDATGPVERADDVAEAVREIFGSRVIDASAGIRIQTYASIPRESAPDEKWYPMTIETPMSYDVRE